MLIFAFETSAKAASVALLEDGVLLGESYLNCGLTHSRTLLQMGQELLETCGRTVRDVTAVACAAKAGGPARSSVRGENRQGTLSGISRRSAARSHSAT